MRWFGVFLFVAVNSVPCPNNGNDNRTTVTLQLNGVWNEISGLVVSSQTFNGESLVWLHDDSGGVPALGLFSTATGELVQRFQLPVDPQILFEDVEDLALGDCGSSWPFAGSGECIYLADTGDNSQVRKNLRIYKMREPTVAGLTKGATSIFLANETQVLRLHYDVASGSPTANADCETIFVDSVGQEPGEAKGDIYLVTKWANANDHNKVRLFRYPIAQQDGTTNVTLQLMSDSPTIRTATWTRGDLTRDGSLAVLGSYFATEFWSRSNGTTIAAMFNASGKCIDMGFSPAVEAQFQQEASGFTATAPFALLDAGECSLSAACNATLYRTPLAAPTHAPTTVAPTDDSFNDGTQLCVGFSFLAFIIFI